MKPEVLAQTDITSLLQRVQDVDQEVEMAVQGIEVLIQRDGDNALRELTRRLDGADVKQPFLRQVDWDELAKQCSDDLRHAIDANLARIEAFHAMQRGEDQRIDDDGLELGRKAVPYDAVGCYVPGGRATYPSTVLMTVVPARIAGVKRIIVATPPTRDGLVSPEVAYAARAAGATDILLAGGAQAVFALAYGTKQVTPVRAIVGPGNSYVTAAKRRVQSVVHTDAPAGPSELLVLADETCPPRAVAWDLLAQAEHDPDAQVVLVATEQAVADAVIAEIKARLPDAPRKDIMQASLEANGRFFIAPLDDAIDFANAYAAEHLEIITADAAAVMARIEHAGSIFLGPHTPVSLGDYGSGTNHVLPTMGFAVLRGGLGVDDFRKWITWQRCSPEALRRISQDITRLARAEGLIGHAEAVERRLEEA